MLIQFSRVLLKITQKLRKIYAKFASGQRKICRTFTQILRKYYAEYLLIKLGKNNIKLTYAQLTQCFCTQNLRKFIKMANSCHFYAQFNLAIHFKSSHELLWCPMTQKKEKCATQASHSERMSLASLRQPKIMMMKTPPTSCICKPFSATVQTVL